MTPPRKSHPKAKALTKAVRARIAYGADKRSTYAFTLPATREAYDAMVEQVARANFEDVEGGHSCGWSNRIVMPKVIKDGWRESAKVMLSSLGITSPAHEAHH